MCVRVRARVCVCVCAMCACVCACYVWACVCARVLHAKTAAQRDVYRALCTLLAALYVFVSVLPV